MSKQSDAKKKQNYVPKAVPRTCSTCKNFLFDHVQVISPHRYMPPNGYWDDKNLRCGLGGFAVKKMGTCDCYELLADGGER
jgi:hypothetical protein